MTAGRGLPAARTLQLAWRGGPSGRGLLLVPGGQRREDHDHQRQHQGSAAAGTVTPESSANQPSTAVSHTAARAGRSSGICR